MSIPPPPLPPSARKPPARLTPTQRILIAVAIVVMIGIVAGSALLVYWAQTHSDDPRLEQGALRQAKERRERLQKDYEDAVAALPDAALPDGWDCEDTLTALNDEYWLAYTVIQALYAADGAFRSQDLAALARLFEDSTAFSDADHALNPFRHSPEMIASNLLLTLQSSEDVKSLRTAVQHGLYFVEFDLAESMYESEVPPRYCAGQMLAACALLEARFGNAESALASYFDALRFAELVGTDPYVSNQFHRRATERFADVALWELTDRIALNDDMISSISNRLASRGNTERLKELIIEDAELAITRQLGPTERNNPFVRAMISATESYDSEGLREAGRELVEMLDKSYQDMNEAASRLKEREEWLIENLVDEACYARQEQLRSACMSDAFKLALALKRYKATTGAYPATLEVLVPDHVEFIPLDPVTERQILYLAWNDGFLLIQPTEHVEEIVDGTDVYYEHDSEDDTLLWRARS